MSTRVRRAVQVENSLHHTALLVCQVAAHDQLAAMRGDGVCGFGRGAAADREPAQALSAG
jgi:hypothetical protein